MKNRESLKRRTILMPVCTIAVMSMPFVQPAALASAEAPPSLKEITVPKIEDLDDFIDDEKKAILLGKALFWDMQLGSDGQACASCHFHAGADPRVNNQLSPGLLEASGPDTTFQPTASGGQGGPNYTLVRADFPFHQFADPDDRNSGVIFTTNDAASSQGAFAGEFLGLGDDLLDDCERMSDGVFEVNGIAVRRVEPRNTPTMINAVFNFRNFWDGRANNVFNGVDPFGLRSEEATVIGKDGFVERVDLRNASLASQAVGPPLDDLEMSCSERTFADVGRKMISRRALATQRVHEDDSVLGGERDKEGPGLKLTYRELIEKAFKDDYWKEEGDFGGFTQMERNFSLFFGLSLQAYQATLISDESPYDEFASGKKEPFDPSEGKEDKLTAAEHRGLDVFLNKGKCVNCHKGAEFTGAASVLQKENEEGGLVERMRMGDGGVALYDNGFYNIGVTPTSEDLGVGRNDPFGNPLSFTKQFVGGNFVDPIEVDPCTFEVPFADSGNNSGDGDSSDCDQLPGDLSSERLAVNGAFKVPTLRNVSLTGPFMHNGSMATLEEVVEFYNRGGNFRNRELDPDIQQLGLSVQEKDDLVTFLHALTDPRVRTEMKPFDHPQLFITHGHPGDENSVQDENGDGLADANLVEIAAVGKDGRIAEGLPPLAPFLEVDFSKLANRTEICENGKPQEMTFVYTGDDCTMSTNFQGDKASCSGVLNQAMQVEIVITKDADKMVVVPSSQAVKIGDMITVDNIEGDGSKELKKDIRLEIRQGGEVLQKIALNASCSEPTYLNDRFGGLMIYGVKPE